MPLSRTAPSRHLFLSSLRLIRSYSSSSSSSLYSFGDNSNGALGLSPPLTDAYEPTRIQSLPSPLATTAAGHYHSLAVTTDGEVWAWGRNVEGQLGRAPSSPRDSWNQPAKVIGLDDVTARAAFASGVVSSVIGDDGSLWVWGRSKRGQLGLGEGVIEAIKPSRVDALLDHQIVKASFGWGHALALTKEGKLFGWGYCKDGRIGAAFDIVEQRTEEEKTVPIVWEPRILEEFSSVRVSDMACGLDHSLILANDGTLMSCGDYTYGQLGRKIRGSKMLHVDMDFKPCAVAAGLGHCLALCETRVISWGWNGSSQLGRRGSEEIPAVVEVLEGEDVVSVSAGRVHSIALTSSGKLWAWGSGRNGRLGLGSSMDEAEPVLLESLEQGFTVLQAVAGFDHNLLLVSELLSC